VVSSSILIEERTGQHRSFNGSSNWNSASGLSPINAGIRNQIGARPHAECCGTFCHWEKNRIQPPEPFVFAA
jgi:hypothetical protein